VAIDAQFAEAWLNTKHKVFGFKLQPFSLWHRFLLEVTESPVVTDIEKVKPADLYAACKLFSLKYPKAEVNLTKLDWVKMFFRIGKKSIQIQGEKLAVYISDHFTAPEFWENDKSGSNKGGPPDQLSAIIPLLMMGFTEEQAWNMPIGKALWYGAAYASWQGADLDFITEEEKEMRENADEIEAQLKAASENFVPFAPDPRKLNK
jgi:hypothetical protein